MRPRSPRGRAATRRVSQTFAIAIIRSLLIGIPFVLPSTASASDLHGTVVDQNGRPLPRAHVRVVSTSAPEVKPGPDASASQPTADRSAARDAITDERGRFAFETRSTDCRVEAAMTGFRTASVACTDAALTIRLSLAPVEETVVVTATRTETPAGQLGLSTTTFTAEDIERRQAPLVSDLLRTSPGAMVMQTGAPGGVAGLFVRGGESNYNTVLIDGIPLNEPGGTFNFSNLTTENLDRIEIVRGANSALFGSDAMSSVVQLFTKRGRPGASSRPTASAQIDGGSYGTLHTSASVSGASERFDYALGAAHMGTDNRVPNSGFDNTTLSANLGARLGAQSTLRAVVRSELGDAGTPGQTVYGRPDLDASYDKRDVAGGLSFDQQLTSRVHQRITYSLASSHQASTNLVEDPPFTPAYEGHVAPFEWFDYTFDTRTMLRRHYASYQADWQMTDGAAAGDHRLTLLADWTGERVRQQDRLADTRTSASRDNVGVALQHQMLWRRIATTAGARVERNDSFGTALAPRGSIVVTLHEGSGRVGETRVHGAAGLGIKEPSVLQSFSTSPYFQGNPDLEPERSRAVEVGVDQRLIAERLRLGATWFDNRYRNIIGLRSTGGVTSEYFNIGLTRARGVEVEADVQPIASVRVRGGYTFVDSEVLESTSASSPVFAVGQWAFRRPRHSGFVQGSWTWQRVSADVVGTAIGAYVDSDFASLEPAFTRNPGRTLWDARASFRFSTQVTGFVAVDNITDRNYQEPLGYLGLGRAARAGIRVGF
jgi:vitamin B12 transporter